VYRKNWLAKLFSKFMLNKLVVPNFVEVTCYGARVHEIAWQAGVASVQQVGAAVDCISK
jgi:hypothetical protein